MMFKALIFSGLLLTLGACSHLPEYPTIPLLAEQGSSAMLGELARVDGLTPAQRHREAADLDTARRLDAPKRFQLAVLLAREDSTDSLERSLQILNSLAEPDVRTRSLLDLMRTSLKARIDLAQQAARTQELQDKLNQIKALEKTLQQRNGTQKAP